MGFTDEDRNTLIETHTLVKTHGNRLNDLEEETKVLHHRVNKVRNLFGGITAAASATVTVVIAWFKLKGD